MMNITQFGEKEKVLIRSLECEADFKKRLAELGLFEGARIEIKKNDGKSPLLIQVLDSRIVLGQAEARKIYGEKA